MGKHSRTRYAWGVVASIFLGIALAVPSGGVAKAAASVAALNGGVAAFEGPNTDLDLCDVPLNGCTATTLGMEPGSSPAVYSRNNGYVWAAFEANTKTLYITERTKTAVVRNINTGYGIAELTTPAVAGFFDDEVAISDAVFAAWQGSNGDLDIYTYAAGVGTKAFDTTLKMYPGTSPSLALTIDNFTGIPYFMVAFANSANHLALYGSGDPFDTSNSTITSPTTLGMEAGTSPSITTTGSGYSAAFEDNDSQLYLTYFDGVVPQSSMTLENIGLPMYPHTNPSLPQSNIDNDFVGDQGEVDAYMANTGYLCAWNDHAKTQNCGFNQLVEGNLALTLVGGDYWAAFESPSSGDFLAYDTATGSGFVLGMYNGTNAALSP
jgi:hypothetical protein